MNQPHLIKKNSYIFIRLNVTMQEIWLAVGNLILNFVSADVLLKTKYFNQSGFIQCLNKKLPRQCSETEPCFRKWAEFENISYQGKEEVDISNVHQFDKLMKYFLLVSFRHDNGIWCLRLTQYQLQYFPAIHYIRFQDDHSLFLITSKHAINNSHIDKTDNFKVSTWVVKAEKWNWNKIYKNIWSLIL